MKIIPDTIGDAVLVHVKSVHGTAVKAAAHWQCSVSLLNDIIHARRRPTEAMLKDIGYRRISTYLPVSVPMPKTALPYNVGDPE